MGDQFADIVRMANREFQEFIEEITKSDKKVAKTRGVVRRLEKVTRRLSQVNHYLTRRATPVLAQTESEYEILKYVENLKALKGILETLQSSLLIEKSHLETTRAKMRAADAWAQSLRQTS